MEKEEVRKKYIDIRNKIENKIEKSEIIFKKFTSDEDFKKAKVVALYKSLESEVDTNNIIEYSLNTGKIVVLPRVIGDNLVFYKIESTLEKLEKSKFGVLEPLDIRENIINSSDIDLVIVPGVAFDKSNNRLGFGKGYYDRFFKDLNVKKIGICFREQIVEKLPTTNLDIKMDRVITD